MGSGSRESNYDRVYQIMGEIMGFDLRAAGWNIHHEIFKSDKKREPELWKNFRVNDISNLFPLPREEHSRLHQMVSDGRRVGVAFRDSELSMQKTVDRSIRIRPRGNKRQAVRVELKRYCGSGLADLNNLQVRGYIYS